MFQKPVCIGDAGKKFGKRGLMKDLMHEDIAPLASLIRLSEGVVSPEKTIEVLPVSKR